MFYGVLLMDNKNKNKTGGFTGIYASSTTSSLKSIANKPIEAYRNKIPKYSDADQKRKKSEADMVVSPFRSQLFVSPISGRNTTSSVEVMVAHGIYDKARGKVVESKELAASTAEVANATFTMTSGVSKILASSLDEVAGQTPVQGRLAFSTGGGNFEIDAKLVNIELEHHELAANNQPDIDDLSWEFSECSKPKPASQSPLVPAKAPISTVASPVTTSKEPTSEEPVVAKIPDPQKPNQILPILSEALPVKASSTPVENAKNHSQYEKTELPSDFYYEMPTLDLLEDAASLHASSDEWAVRKMEILETTFDNFGVAVTVTGDYIQGATVTQFEIIPEPGTKLNRIKGLADDLKLALSVDDLRIAAIAKKNAIGVEIANDERRIVRLKEILSSPEFILHESPLFIGLGEDISGNAVYTDILTMPHGLIAGATGSGKSVCINTLLVSILYKSTPDVVRLMLIDPKRVEMAPYNNIPHLVTPVITDEKKAATALSWAVEEMERRYELFAKNGVRDIKTFNKRRHEFKNLCENLPYIVIIIDELADLMMVAAGDVEDSIMRLTQKARAAGLHLIVATQRPTVNVITGTIKSNVPTRIAFAVAQANDSRVILDGNGAEDLLGRGDLLISEAGNKIRRVQGAFVSDDEVAGVVAAVCEQAKPQYLIADDALDKPLNNKTTTFDELEQTAMAVFIDEERASASLLQRKLNIGYNRAANLVDNLEAKGLISQPIGATSKREILITKAELATFFDNE